LLQNPYKSCDTVTLTTYSKDQPDHSPQTTPPLALCAPGKVGTPSLLITAHGYTLLDLEKAGAKSTKKTGGTQSVDSSTTGATDTTEIHCLGQARKIRKNKPMPP
jgi:hypothetical protein